MHLPLHELLLKAGELGCAKAYFNLGFAYYSGSRGVETDKKKAHYYYELAAWVGVYMHGTIWVVRRELLAIIIKQ